MAACTGSAQVQTRWSPSDEIGRQTQAITPKYLSVIGTQSQRKKLISSGIIWSPVDSQHVANPTGFL